MRRHASLTPSTLVSTLLLLALGPLTVLGALPTLAASEVEPPETGPEAYWGDGGTTTTAPFPIPRFNASDMDRARFEAMVRAGRAFVVAGVGDAFPMRDWDCDTFRTDPAFKQADMQMMYGEGGGAPFVNFGSDWKANAQPSGAADNKAPQKAPFYWGIKDIQYPDGASPTWRRNMLEKVRKNTVVPSFMDPGNARDFKTTPEFWFAVSGAGAKAHIDTHVQTTMSLQLASRKRWRIGFMPQRALQHVSMLYRDGAVYEHEHGEAGEWVPTHDVVLEKGEALFIPPGFIHETTNLGDSCAASVTYQFSQPMASSLYRNFLPRVRRTPDIWESWPLIRDWATFGMHEDENDADGIFSEADRNHDGKISLKEASKARLEHTRPQDAIAFHDENEDGEVSREEFERAYGKWVTLERQAMSKKSHSSIASEVGLKGVSVEQLHYEVLEDLDNHPRYSKKLAAFQKKRMTAENQIFASAERSAPKAEL